MKVGFDATRRLKTRDIVYEDESRDGDITVWLVETSLFLTLASKPSTAKVITYYI